MCAQCHLMGETRVAKPHRSETSYRPGDRLSMHVVPFVSRFASSSTTARRSGELKAFWDGSVIARDTALAYADEAWLQGDSASARQAHQKLLAVFPSVANDGAVAAQLGYKYDLGGEADAAGRLYRQALGHDPENLIALTIFSDAPGSTRAAAGRNQVMA